MERRAGVAVCLFDGRRQVSTRLRLKNPQQKALPVQDLAGQLPAQTWVRAKIKEDTKGPQGCEFACLRVSEVRDGLLGQERWLVAPQSG